jgi:hypothetical protein
MDELEDKLNAVLSNPQMMQQIMTMAQAMGQSAPALAKEDAPPPRQDSPLPEFDLGMLQKISGIANQGSIDREQQALLRALDPYLSRERIGKLERAMRAAKMAKFASAAMQQGRLLSTGR